MKKSPYFIFCLIVSVLILGGFSPSSAEGNSYYVVQGTITSRINVGISGLKVLIINKGINGDTRLAETMSDDSGNYIARFSPPAGASRLNLQVQAYDSHNLLLGSSAVRHNASNHETINIQIGTANIIDEDGAPEIKVDKILDSAKNARAGYGITAGYMLGLSGIYWAEPVGGQVMIAKIGNGAVNVSGRLHFKLFNAPFGRISVAPQLGYQFNGNGGSSGSNTSYGVVGMVEFINTSPDAIHEGKNAIGGENTWLSVLAFEKAKAVGLSAEIGYYGQDIRNVVLDPSRLTPGFSMAVHIYL